MDILTFKEQVEDKHGPFAQVPLKVLVEEKGIDMDIPVSFKRLSWYVACDYVGKCWHRKF